MNDYFSTVKRGLGDAVERRAHLRWYAAPAAGLARTTAGGHPRGARHRDPWPSAPRPAGLNFGKPQRAAAREGAGFLWGLENREARSYWRCGCPTPTAVRHGGCGW